MSIRGGSAPHGQNKDSSRHETESLCVPFELIKLISEFLFTFIPPSDDSPSIISKKPTWQAVCGFMAASPELHTLGYLQWVRVLTVIEPEDWEEIEPLSHLVLELKCVDGVLVPTKFRTILTKFPHLQAVTIDSHSDVFPKGEQFAYRNLIRELPPGLLRFEITRAHGPDLKVIETVRNFCPNLLVLRLGRCTMFNNVPPCTFWVAFPLDHDAYIAAVGTDDYSHSVAQELVSLTHLKSLQLGVYLMPSTAVLEHRVYHARGLDVPTQVSWQQALSDLHGTPIPEPPARLDTALLVPIYHQDSEPDFGPASCSACQASLAPSRRAEQISGTIFKRLLPRLEMITWMDWFSPSHLGVSGHSVETAEGAQNQE